MKRGEVALSVSRGAFYLGIEKAAALLSGIAYFVLLLRWLGPTKYGMITLALSFVGLATMATGNFEVYLERYAAEFQTHGRLKLLRRAHRTALALKLALGLLASVVLLALTPWLARSFETPELVQMLPVLSLLVAFDGLYSTGRATLYGLQRFPAVCGLAIGYHVSKTVLVGSLWGLHQGLNQLAIGLVVLTTLQGVLAVALPIWMLRGAQDHPTPEAEADALERGSKGLLASMMSYCMPLLGARAAFLTGQNLGKVVLGKLFNTTQLGYFSFAFQTTERFVELASTLSTSLLPSLTQMVARGERDRLRWVFDQAFRLIQVAACALSFALFVFAPEVTLLVGSPMFAPAVPLLRIMALVPIARTAQQPLTMLFQALRRPGVVLGLALVKLLVEFGGYFVLVPMLGLAGAGWANLSGAMMAYVAALVLASRILPEGAAERLRAVRSSVLLIAPLLLLGLWFDQASPAPWDLVARGGLVVAAVAGAFALGLVNGYDLEKLSSVPLGTAWLRLVRDTAVAGANRLAQALAPRRT